MPPVFGPRSPSKTRLWSWEEARGRICSPSVRAIKEASSPLSISSMTTLSPAHPKVLCTMILSMAASASSRSEQRVTPFPPARPSALTTQDFFWATYLLAESGSENVAKAAVGIRFSSIISLAKALLPSNLAAPRLGPKIFSPLFSKRSTIPRVKGSSGPTTVRSIFSFSAKSLNFSTSSGRMDTSSTISPMPSLPGAQ